MAEPLRVEPDWTNHGQMADFKRFVHGRLKIQVKPNVFVNYEPHSGQVPIHFPKKGEEWSVMVVPAGQRSGKSIAGAVEITDRLGMPGQRMWIVAPNYDLTLRVFEMVYDFVVRQQIHGKGSVLASSISKPDNRFIEMKGGSFVRCKSADNPNSLVGERLTFVLLDEAAQLAEEIWTSYLEPRLVNLNGQALLISSPRGMNWFQKYYLRGKAKKTQALGWRCSKFRTQDNPFIEKSTLDRIRAVTPKQVWEQEYEANFVSGSGLVYPMYRDDLYPQGHLFDPAERPVPADATHYYAVDIGVVHPTAAVCGAVDRRGDLWIYRDYEAAGRNHADHARYVKNMFQNEMLQGWISKDADRKGPNEDRLNTARAIYAEEGLFPYPANTDWSDGVSLVQAHLMATVAAPKSTTHPRLFVSKDCLHVRKGFLAYMMQGRVHHQREEVKSALPEKARKWQDDTMDAVRYFISGRPRYVAPPEPYEGSPLGSLTSEFHVENQGYHEPRVDFS